MASKNSVTKKVVKAKDSESPLPWVRVYDLAKAEGHALTAADCKSLFSVSRSAMQRDEAVEIVKGIRTACATALDLLQHITTDTFKSGGDRVVRERLEEAIERVDLDLAQMEGR